MKRIVFSLLAIVMLAGGGLQAQQRPVKSKVVFEADSLPSQLLRFLNGNMKAEDKLAANAQVVQQFEGAYNAMTRDRREKVVALYNNARKTKLEAQPDYVNLTQTLVAYNGAKVSATVFDEWVEAMNAIMTITSKKKAMVEFIQYTADLLADRTLYKSRTSVWRVESGAVFSFVPLRNDVKTVFKGTVNL